MYRAGYQEATRRYLTKKIVSNYDKVLREHNEGTKIMYREDQTRKKKKSALWFKKKGYNYNMTVPATEDDQLKSKMKKTLEEISDKKILISKQYGPKTLSSLKLSSNKKTQCDRKQCNICRHGGSKEICQRSNCGYL